MWWDSTDDQLYVLFNNQGTLQWVVANNQPGPAGATGATGPAGPVGPPGTPWPEAPTDGSLYGRDGATASWQLVPPEAPLGGLAYLRIGGNQSNPGSWVPGLPISGGTLTGALVLDGNATVALNPVPLQQLNSATALLAPINNPTFTGTVTIPAGANIAGYLPLAGGTLTGGISGTTATFSGDLAAIDIGAGGALTVSSNAGISGTLNVSQTATFTDGRVISERSGNNPAFTVYDTAAPASAFCMFNQASNLQFGIADGNGNPTAALGRFDPSGNLIIIGTLSQGSDETTKNTITAFTPGLSIISQLLPKTFIYNNDTTNTQHLGFIAQDVEPILPDAVGKQPAFDPSGPPTLTLDPTAILAVAINAVKQLLSRIQALESAANITPTAAETA